MTRWLLNNVPGWLLSVCIVGGFLALGLGMLRVMRERLPDLVSTTRGEAGGNAIVIVIGLYGILLAFVVLMLFESFATAESNAEHEASALAQVRHAGQALPPGVGGEVDSVLADYVHVVVGQEWDSLRQGRASQEAWDTIDRLYQTLGEYEPESESQVIFYGQAVENLDQALEARRARITDAEQGLPSEFLILVFGGAVLVIGFLCLGGSSNQRAHALFVGGVAALVGFNVLLVLILDHPYSGDIAIDPDAFMEGTLSDFF